MNGVRSFLVFWTNHSMASLTCTCNCFYELQVANLHILARRGNSVCECRVCVYCVHVNHIFVNRQQTSLFPWNYLRGVQVSRNG